MADTGAFKCELVGRVVTAEDCSRCLLARNLCEERGPWFEESPEVPETLFSVLDEERRKEAKRKLEGIEWVK